jgi:ribosomal protein S12 methylthiotransferase accessory factor
MEMEISFPGGKKVNSTYRGFTVETDQAKEEGGQGSAPEPYDLFLASIGTCAGIYVASFCQQREIDTSKLKLTLEFDRNEKTHLIEEIRIQIHLPPGFPEKYTKAIIRTAELCTVKRNILTPPLFAVTAEIEK